MALHPTKDTAFPASQKELVKIQFKYGGPKNDEEEWFKGLPSALPFPENPYLEKWESMKINFDLMESKKRLNISDGRPITTHVPYEAVTAFGGFSKEDVYDSGSRFKLPRKVEHSKKAEGVYDFAASHRATSENVWKKILGQFNAGGPLFDNTNGKYAPRLVLPVFQYPGPSSKGPEPGPATSTTTVISSTRITETTSTTATGGALGTTSTPITGGPSVTVSTPITGDPSVTVSTPAAGGPPGTPATPGSATAVTLTPEEIVNRARELFEGVMAGTTHPTELSSFLAANPAAARASASSTPAVSLTRFDATREAAISGGASRFERARPTTVPAPSSRPRVVVSSAAEPSDRASASASSSLKRKHRPARILDPTYRPVPLSPRTRRLDEEISEEEVFEEEETPTKRPKVSKTVRPHASSAEAGSSRQAASRVRPRSTTPKSRSSRDTGAGEGSSASRPSSVRKGKAKMRGPVQFANPDE